MSDLIKELSNSHFYSREGGELTSNKIMQFWTFVKMLQANRKITIIYRIDSNDNISSQFKIEDPKDPISLGLCLFFVGVKGKAFLEKVYLNPEETTEENFLKIINLLRKAIKTSPSSTSNRNKKMIEFEKNNKNFYEEISDTNKFNNLYNIYSTQSEKAKKRWNAYYLSLIHTINCSDYKKESTYVSTTKDRTGINGFNGDIEIIGWCCRKNDDPFMFRDINENYRNEIGNKLPTYDISPYPKQEEVALKYGFLPHYIIGFRVKDKFYVNPILFTFMDNIQGLQIKMIENKCHKVSEDGFEIDQHDIGAFIKRNTNFKEYFKTDGESVEAIKIETH